MPIWRAAGACDDGVRCCGSGASGTGTGPAAPADAIVTRCCIRHPHHRWTGHDEDRVADARTVSVGRPLGSAERQVGGAMQGKVKFFDNDRGFGFISREGGEDVFVHVSNLQAGVTTLAEGQTVEFDVGPGRKSEEAKNVRSA